MLRSLCISLIITTILSSPAFVADDANAADAKAAAKAAVMEAGAENSPAAHVYGQIPPCTMTQQVNVTVSYNFKAKSFADAKKMFDEQNTKIEEFAKQQQIKKLNLQSQSYNINSQPIGYAPDGTPQDYTYQINGNSTYNMDNTAAAMKFAEFLSSQKIQVSLNSNSYKSGNCTNPVAVE